jgi:membrane-bound ClpP family serine protease
MLFLFKGHNGPLLRAIVGAVLVVIGVAIHGAAIMAGIGVVLLVWAAVGAFNSQRGRRQGHVGTGGRIS